MEARYFYFTIHSARNLKDVRKIGDMKVYAKVTIAGTTKYTEVDLENTTNPEWNTTLRFFVPEKDIIREDVRALIELFCQRSLSHDKYVVAGKSKCTEVDDENETNPKWNATFGFNVPELEIVRAQGKISVKIELFCKRNLKDDKYVGEVNLSLDSQCAKSSNTCSVKRTDTHYDSSDFGTLTYSSVLGDKITVEDTSKQDFANNVAVAGLGTAVFAAMVAVADLLQ